MGSFRRKVRASQDIGPTERGPYHNVLVMKVDDPMAVLEAIERLTVERQALYDAIARVASAMPAFEFSSAEGFKDNAKSILFEWLPSLAALQGRGILAKDSHGHTIRFAPPLVITSDQVDWALEGIGATFRQS
jgi:adenosylmethionine-8-amino-7-oxononanoate aminotransferase